VPTYEYRCPNGHLFEVFKSITAPAPEVCSVCGEGPLEVVLHPVAVHFKGSGFYNTDYGTRKRSRENEAASESGSKEGAKDSKESKSSESTKSSSNDSSNGSAPKSDSGAKKAAA